jgi:hypothetical protein
MGNGALGSGAAAWLRRRLLTARCLPLLAIPLSLLGMALVSTPASAMTREVGCSSLQTTIAEVAAEHDHGEGEVIVLNGLCDGTALKSSSGVRIPAESNLTIEGAPGTSSGFDGAGVTGPLLGTGSEEAGTIDLSNLTFQHADLSSASALSIHAARVTLDRDDFLEDEESGQGAHAAFLYIGQSDCPPAGSAAITLTDSSFEKDKLQLGSFEGGGAAAWLQDTCPSSSSVIEGNKFEGNSLEASGTPEEETVAGAGLYFLGQAGQPAQVSQSANVFDSNTLTATSPSVGNYGGGGEWLEEATLASAGDRFSRNTIAGTVAATGYVWSWGAGLGIFNHDCPSVDLPESTLENAVVTGNVIGPGTDIDLGGGGIWVGCSHLRVLDSTFTLNSAPTGAGIEGETGDQIEVANSIVAEDSGVNEIAGFAEPGGSVKVQFSDVCAEGGSSEPLPGTGNICANPRLADDGEPDSFDVHETPFSPTTEAGSLALLPDGLTTDFYGNPRVSSSPAYTPACTGPPPPPRVLTLDMGADETPSFRAEPTIVSSCPPHKEPPMEEPVGGQAPSPGPAATLRSPLITLHPQGLLTLTFKGLAAGRLQVRITFKVTRSIVVGRAGHRRRIERTVSELYGQAKGEVTATGKLVLQIEPSRAARALLEEHGHLATRAVILLTASGGAKSQVEQALTVAYRAARGKHHG